jgi:hypothetical protein
MNGSTQQGSSNAPEVTNFEFLRQQLDLVRLRMTFQNKCVEMSIQVTAGLAAAIAGAIIASISNTSGNEEIANIQKKEPILIFLPFLLYGITQSLLLANYIYHSYCFHIHDCIARIMQGTVIRQAAPVDFTLENKGGNVVRQAAAFRTPKLLAEWWRDRSLVDVVFGRLIIAPFQSIVLHASVAMGLFLDWWFVPTSSRCCVLILAFLSFAWVVLIVAHWMATWYARHHVSANFLIIGPPTVE